MEEWRPVVGNHNYVVSNDGRIRRRGSIKDHSVHKDKYGYLNIHLYKDGKCQHKKVNRVVAEAFIPNPENKPEVNHIDCNKLNNHVSNLEWNTKKENMKHAKEHGLTSHKPSYGMLGKKNPNGGRKGKPFRIVETGEVFNTLLECEKAINGNDSCIGDCLNGKQKTHKGYHFEYI